MACHHGEISLGSASRQLIDLLNACGERFLHENMFTCIKGLFGEVEVTCCRCRNYDAMNAGILENNLMPLYCATEGEI